MTFAPGDMEGYLEWEINMNNRTTLPTGEITEERTALPFHKCTENDKKKYMYEFKESQKSVMTGLWLKGMLCLDNPEHVILNGHSTTIQRNVVTYDLKKCHGKLTCKEDAEINDYINSR